ncbi:MAG: HlyD family type I secretion periplasmic adaptor subunit, partial [Rhodospirillales bacterium]|nr:HlyD family type I secretion periplasmic adaptor subunit [Rhodospirillales bacterium]
MAIADTGSSAERPPLEQLLRGHPIPTWRIVAWPVMILMLSMMTWAYFAEIEEFTVASGEVVPVGKVKVVQHLEGGIIEELFVKDGDLVVEGQPLLQLDLGSGGTNIEELQVRRDSAILAAARLEAEATGNPLEFPPDEAERRPEMVRGQRQTYEARPS